MEIVKFKFKYYKQVNRIYKNSFPKEERYQSLFSLICHTYRKKANLYCLLEEDMVIGFIYLIQYENMLFILYLAVDEKKRSGGVGSYLLNWCQSTFQNKIIYLNIEEVNDKFKDNEIRKKRLNFYLRNQFYLVDYLSCEEEGNFNILSNQKIFDKAKYEKLDMAVAKLLKEESSEIRAIKR